MNITNPEDALEAHVMSDPYCSLMQIYGSNKMPAKPNTQTPDNILEDMHKAMNQIYITPNCPNCPKCLKPMKPSWIHDSLILEPTCECEGSYIPETDR